MPIRIACPNRCRDPRQTIVYQGRSVVLVGYPKASCTVYSANPRIP